MAEQEKSPRDLTKRPASRSANTPDHERLGKHGVRTTAQTQEELREENFKQAQREEYEEGRNTGAGPNPYKLERVDSRSTKKGLDSLSKTIEGDPRTREEYADARLQSYLESSRESKAADAEVQSLGTTVNDTGQKIVLEPDRVAADEKAVLPKAGTPHEEATKEAGEDDMSADKNPGAGAPEVQR